MSKTVICLCPDISDEDWHLKDQDWSGKFFYFEDVLHIFNLPVGWTKAVEAMKSDLVRKGYQALHPEMVLHVPGQFSGRIFTEIEDPKQYDANVELFENARILTRVYRGSKSGLGNAIEEIKAFAQDRSHILPGVIYQWRASCDICGPRRGGEVVVLFARV